MRIVELARANTDDPSRAASTERSCELAVLASQCLNRRLPDLAIIGSQVAAWERDRNEQLNPLSRRLR